MRVKAVALVVALVGLLAVPTAAAGAAANTTAPDAPGASGPGPVQIDNATTLVDTSFNNSSGMATLTIESDVPQSVVITDSGGVVRGGVVDQREIELRPGETRTVQMPVTRTPRGFVGVTIATRSLLWSEPLRQPETGPQTVDPGESSWAGVVLAAGGGFGGSTVAIGAALYYARRKWGGDDGPQSEVLA
jgi:hypothetical protein